MTAVSSSSLLLTCHRLTHEAAELCIARATEVAKKENLNVSIAVVDSCGDLVAFRRMDKAMPISSKIATGKAQSAVGFARETKLLEDGNNNGRAALLSAGAVLMAGGVPIKHQGSIIGAIGVSGATPQQDQVVALGAQSFMESKL